jgi:hypothetical protein
MKVHALWYGGPEYTDNDPGDYMEEFDSIMSAWTQLYNRATIGTKAMQTFNYINYAGEKRYFLPDVKDSYMELFRPGQYDKPFAKLTIGTDMYPRYQLLKDAA